MIGFYIKLHSVILLFFLNSIKKYADKTDNILRILKKAFPTESLPEFFVDSIDNRNIIIDYRATALPAVFVLNKNRRIVTLCSDITKELLEEIRKKLKKNLVYLLQFSMNFPGYY